MLSRWQRVCEGEGHLSLVVGEAGIGKSRLVAEFHSRIRDTPHIWLESAGEQFFQNSPFHALTEMLSQWLQMQGGGANAGEMLLTFGASATPTILPINLPPISGPTMAPNRPMPSAQPTPFERTAVG